MQFEPDNEADGDVDYYITATPMISDDTAYKALAPAQVKLTNLDDPAMSVSVRMVPAECLTTEAGGECLVTLTVAGWYTGTTQFTKDRYRLPFQRLTLTISSSNVGEGRVATPLPEGRCPLTMTVHVEGQQPWPAGRVVPGYGMGLRAERVFVT